MVQLFSSICMSRQETRLNKAWKDYDFWNCFFFFFWNCILNCNSYYLPHVISPAACIWSLPEILWHVLSSRDPEIYVHIHALKLTRVCFTFPLLKAYHRHLICHFYTGKYTFSPSPTQFSWTSKNIYLFIQKEKSLYLCFLKHIADWLLKGNSF